MRIEVIVNGRLTATKEVLQAEIAPNPYATPQANHEMREKIIKSHLKEIKQKLRPILSGYSSYDLQFRLVFPSKMNYSRFEIKEDKGFKYLKTA
jgi:hypothetical protein